MEKLHIELSVPVDSSLSTENLARLTQTIRDLVDATIDAGDVRVIDWWVTKETAVSKEYRQCPRCGHAQTKSITNAWAHVNYHQMLQCTSQKSH